jgi:hypothetical protein
MSLYRIDGWDYYPAPGQSITANLAADGWVGNIAQMSSFAGRFGGNAIGFSNNFGFLSTEPIGTRYTTQTCVIGHGLTINTNGNMGGAIGAYDGEGGGGYQWVLQFEQDGVIRLYRNQQGGGGLSMVVIATSHAKAIHGFEWNEIEIKHKVHNTSGFVEVRINTVVVLSYVGNTANTTVPPILGLPYGWDSIGYVGAGGVPIYWDDRYILVVDGVGNNDYLGNVRVNAQLTTAPGDLTEMLVTGAAANWDAVNEAVLTETEYVYSSTIGNRDLYTMNPSITALNIFGVQVVGAWRQDDATQMMGHSLIKTHGTIYEGADNELAQNYHYYRDLYELNPNTGVGWTAAELNAVQAGQKLLAG